jgi:membrane protease YdiL (CAAX protease family)
MESPRASLSATAQLRAVLRLAPKPLVLCAFWVTATLAASMAKAPFGAIGAVVVGCVFLRIHGLWGNSHEARARRAEVHLQPWASRRLWLLGTTVALMVFLLGCLLIRLWAGGPDDTSNATTILNASLFATCLVGPFIEEVAFRGWLLRRIEPSLGRRKAVLVCAFLFALIHFQLPGFPVRFVSAVVGGIAVYATRSLWAAIFLHVLNNSVLLGLAHLFPDFSLGHRTVITLGIGLCVAGLGLLGLALATRWFWRGSNPQEPPPDALAVDRRQRIRGE